MLSSLSLFVLLVGVAGLLFSLFLLIRVLLQDGGSGRPAEIADQIHHAAMAFMARELKVIGLFTLTIVLLVAIFISLPTALAFLLGAFCSSIAGLIGMFTATKANVRTAIAACHQGRSRALVIAFFSGAVMGLSVASLGLLGIGLLFVLLVLYHNGEAASPYAIEGFAMGASVVALFYRVGGGIFTKAADVGADLVGKVEAGIPEDDPRNPGVIADNVGDNVGDVAGMGSDIFESYCGAQIATIIIAATMSAAVAGSLVTGTGEEKEMRLLMMFLPLALAAVGLICSTIGIATVRAMARWEPVVALRSGVLSATLLFILAALFAITALGIHERVWVAVVIGSVGGLIIGSVTEYYTGGRPMRGIGRCARTGTATVLITGLAVGLESVVVPMLTIAGIIVISYVVAFEYGVGIAAVGMLATVGITMAIDAYGPVADNAGGIAEMAGMGAETRRITDSLDAVGNTTAAIGKGFSLGAAGLAALTMIKAFMNVVEHTHRGREGVPEDFIFTLDLANPIVLAGVFIGGLTAFFNGAITVRAVGGAAFEMIEEIRRQFREIPGLLKGKAEPDARRCVKIAADGAMKRLAFPALLAIGMPILVGFVLGAQALGGMLVGALVCCIALGLLMANAGGAWDNAKKWIEEGNEGGKGSAAHWAAVVGDTVGDPLKDTSGPSMAILVNVMAIWSLVIAPMLMPVAAWCS